MRKKSILVTLGVMLLAMLACELPDLPWPEGTPDSSSLATMVESQLQTLLPSTATEATPDGEPTASTPPTPTSTEPLCQPQPPAPLPPPMPAGVAVTVPDSEIVELIDFQGNILQSRDASGLVFEDPEFLHVAGPISQGPFALPVLFHALENNGVLKVNVQGATNPVEQVPMMIAMAGAEGEPFIAYSNYDSSPAGWISYLYAADLGDFPGVAPLLTRDQGDGYVYFPLAIRSVSGQAEGVWYTLSMYGIGNIIFPPYRGLYYLDLQTLLVTEYLGFDQYFASLSPDQTWLSYRSNSSSPQNGIYLRNMTTCAEVFIPADPTSVLGAGYVVFSPDNSKAAWIEASGDIMGEIDLLVRVAATDGTIIAQSPMANLFGLAGGEELTWIKPVGWVDNQQVLYEMSLQDWSQKVITRAEANFHNPIPVVLGSDFMGFYYP
jgi:hypothetical protein